MNKALWLLRHHGATLALWGGVALALLALVANALVMQPLQEQLAALAEVQARSGGTERAADAAARAGTPAQQLADFYAHFDKAPKLTVLLGRLNAVAKASGLELASAEYRLSSSPDQRLQRYQIVIPVTGSYRTIRVFVARALRELPTMSLDLVQLQRKSIADTDVEAQISFTLHLPR
ncbi:conserved hypothetical protein [Rubrivivax sp. A210]|uniref:GspMb/PilO family protein n=1 Tax=Rubrivivax sp. A210 TaxID=2772301 RepID=UPI001919CD3A|nr:GspMb/PilO family protein [Rubrivivax sp. A210]CAD5369840.1 conserved hypothetical protein [Rubrivivax sp. A210]